VIIDKWGGAINAINLSRMDGETFAKIGIGIAIGIGIESANFSH